MPKDMIYLYSVSKAETGKSRQRILKEPSLGLFWNPAWAEALLSAHSIP